MLKKFITEKPFLPLSFTIVAVMLIAVFKRDYLADLQVNNAYIVVPIPVLAGLFTVILAISSLAYWLIRKRKSINQLTYVHVFGTTGIAIYLMCFLGLPPDSKTALGYSLSIAEYQKLEQLNNQLIIGILVLGLIQLLLIVHIILILVRDPKEVA
ncbi:hypothetical protein [Dyadobacter sp. NIV53]|uniref:hypothetical protein n=1 Tax=Dyadobacter sp. NIV53 TaxID=2861765 RepID=UPI001C8810A3|nr:hypothetical protein [Dyadobacter sp. NIV53]